MKALVCLSKYLGTYLEFKEKLRQYGIKWTRPDNFNAFLSILNNKHDDLKEWYGKVQNVLDKKNRLFLRFVLLSGLMKGEALKSFNKVLSSSF
jgi:hypothetical protein